jgi:hypothetical protein
MIVCVLSMGINCSVVDAFSYGVGKRSTVVILSRAWGSACPEADPETPIAQTFQVFLRSPNYRQPYHVDYRWTVCYRTNRAGKTQGDCSRSPSTVSQSSTKSVKSCSLLAGMFGHRLLIPGFLHLSWKLDEFVLRSAWAIARRLDGSDLDTKAEMPTDRASLSSNALLNPLKRITGTWALMRFIARVASNPFKTGIDRSIMTSSGAARRSFQLLRARPGLLHRPQSLGRSRRGGELSVLPQGCHRRSGLSQWPLGILMRCRHPRRVYSKPDRFESWNQGSGASNSVIPCIVRGSSAVCNYQRHKGADND